MEKNNLKITCNQLFEFSTLFHEKFSNIFRKDKNIKYNCNKNQNKTIMLLGNKEKATSSELCKCLDLRKGSLTTLIDSLVKMNLVYRKTDENDRRKTLIYLTDEGKNYLELKRNEMESNIIRLFEKLDNKEINELNNNLNNIIKILKKI